MKKFLLPAAMILLMGMLAACSENNDDSKVKEEKNSNVQSSKEVNSTEDSQEKTTSDNKKETTVKAGLSDEETAKALSSYIKKVEDFEQELTQAYEDNKNNAAKWAAFGREWNPKVQALGDEINNSDLSIQNRIDIGTAAGDLLMVKGEYNSFVQDSGDEESLKSIIANYQQSIQNSKDTLRELTK
ncbi:hypothetical protein [Falsibacillus albus]|uniref:Lipoprotein n=1 Tax=Falsibacillus albus TaxID=2478915 RepID=A0A3L7JPP1_9BACI|nr:hypothetical protein [Falsibacillus albus]RLQ92294.1 hypothetical protein D9X91_19655 [Falsibacillus albus]